MKLQFARRLSSFALISAATAVIAVYSPTAEAQACSAADDQVRAQYQQASLQALMSGDLSQYRSLQQSLPGALSSPCRTRLDQLEPMRVRCTAQEKSTVLAHYQAIVQAVQNVDLDRVFDVIGNLEATVSRPCWLATNRHTDPQVVNACTVGELDHLAEFAGPILRATRVAMNTLDAGPLIQLTQQLAAPLSQHCYAAIIQNQQKVQQAQNAANAYLPQNVYDHGGGTYSVPGTGACTSTECIAY